MNENKSQLDREFSEKGLCVGIALARATCALSPSSLAGRPRLVESSRRVKRIDAWRGDQYTKVFPNTRERYPLERAAMVWNRGKQEYRADCISGRGNKFASSSPLFVGRNIEWGYQIDKGMFRGIFMVGAMHQRIKGDRKKGK